METSEQSKLLILYRLDNASVFGYTNHHPWACGINKRADTNSGFHIKGANHLKSLQLSVYKLPKCVYTHSLGLLENVGAQQDQLRWTVSLVTTCTSVSVCNHHLPGICTYHEYLSLIHIGSTFILKVISKVQMDTLWNRWTYCVNNCHCCCQCSSFVVNLFL